MAGPTNDELRAELHRAADWAADFLERVGELPVYPRIQPGEVTASLPEHPPAVGEPLSAMIDDVDASLRAMLEAALGAGPAIRFEPPTPQWSDALVGAAVDLFLYDVTEEIERRTADWEDWRGDDGRGRLDSAGRNG